MNILKLGELIKNKVPVNLLLFTQVLFILGFYKLCNAVIIIVCLIILSNPKKFNLKKVFNNKYFWFLSSYFFLTLFGSLFYPNFLEGIQYVEQKLLFLVFPLIFFSLNLEKNNREFLMKGFIIFILLGLIIGFINAVINYANSSDLGYFYSDNLVGILNKQAIYYSIFVNIALLFVFYFILTDKKRNIFFFGLGGLLFFFQFLLSGRVGIFIMLSGTVLFLLTFPYKKFLYKVTSILFFVIISFSSLYFFSQTLNRMKSLMLGIEYDFKNENPVNHFNGKLSKNNWNGLTIRLALWDCGLEIIKDNPWFGVGTGGYNQVLYQKFKQKKFNYALEQDFGIHNQYLYTLISFGIVGLIVFLFSIVSLVVYAFKKNNYIFIIFTIVVLLTLVTENVFNRYIGVYIYSFINAMLFSLKK